MRFETYPTTMAARGAVAAMLEAERPALDAVCQAVGGCPMGEILAWPTQNLDAGSYPAVMLTPAAERFEWIGLPDLVRWHVSAYVAVLALHDEPGVQADLVSAVSTEVWGILLESHLGWTLPNGGELRFADGPPIEAWEYGAMEMGSSLVGAARGLWRASVDLQLVSA